MKRPTTEQKAALAAQLDAMESGQWTALMAWYADKLLFDDHALLLGLLVRQAQRVKDQHDAVSTVQSQMPLESHLAGVLRDVGLCLSTTGDLPPPTFRPHN